MISLKISDFSCIKFAEIELRPLTIVIGPQASGKSLVSKLIYFFVDIIESSFAFSTNASRSNALLRDIESRFENMFPSGSWGKNPFEIKFTAGDIQFTVRRKIRTNKPLSRVEVTASSYFTELYHNHVTSTAKFVRKKSNDDNLSRLSPTATYDFPSSPAVQLIATNPLRVRISPV